MRSAAGPWLCRPLVAEDAQHLEDFLKALDEGDRNFFHPHPFDPATITAVCSQPRQDYFCGGFSGNHLASYGMLRGWNEGHENPSLGLAIHPDFRGSGWAGRMLAHLHQVAAERGCQKIRLSVYLENHRAVRLFERAGYRLEPGSGPRAVGWRHLQSHDRHDLG